MKSLVPALFLIAACGSTNKEVAQPTPASVSSSAKASRASSEEVATGDLRDALIKLQRIHFSLDSTTLLPEAQQALGDAGQILKKYPDVSIYVEGNSDERGTAEYNVALSEKRARTVVDYLSKLGITESRLTIVPKGETDPLETGANNAALASNRRVDFRLQRGEVRLVLQEGVRYDDKGNRIAGE